jgi:hypothetical protein
MFLFIRKLELQDNFKRAAPEFTIRVVNKQENNFDFFSYKHDKYFTDSDGF